MSAVGGDQLLCDDGKERLDIAGNDVLSDGTDAGCCAPDKYIQARLCSSHELADVWVLKPIGLLFTYAFFPVGSGTAYTISPGDPESPPNTLGTVYEIGEPTDCCLDCETPFGGNTGQCGQCSPKCVRVVIDGWTPCEGCRSYCSSYGGIAYPCGSTLDPPALDGSYCCKLWNYDGHGGWTADTGIPVPASFDGSTTCTGTSTSTDTYWITLGFGWYYGTTVQQILTVSVGTFFGWKVIHPGEGFSCKSTGNPDGDIVIAYGFGDVDPLPATNRTDVWTSCDKLYYCDNPALCPGDYVYPFGFGGVARIFFCDCDCTTECVHDGGCQTNWQCTYDCNKGSWSEPVEVGYGCSRPATPQDWTYAFTDGVHLVTYEKHVVSRACPCIDSATFCTPSKKPSRPSFKPSQCPKYCFVTWQYPIAISGDSVTCGPVSPLLAACQDNGTHEEDWYCNALDDGSIRFLKKVKYSLCGTCTAVGKTAPAAPTSQPFFIRWRKEIITDTVGVTCVSTAAHIVSCSSVAHALTCIKPDDTTLRWEQTIRYEGCGGGTITPPDWDAVEFRTKWTTVWDCVEEAWGQPSVELICVVGAGTTDWEIVGLTATRYFTMTCGDTTPPDVPEDPPDPGACCAGLDEFCSLANGHTVWACGNEINCMESQGGGGYLIHCGDHDVCVTVTSINLCDGGGAPESLCHDICDGQPVYRVTVTNPC